MGRLARFASRSRTPRYRPPRLIPAILMLALLALMILRAQDASSPPAESFPSPSVSGEQARFAVVHRVVDGDTLLLESGERVRLIGVDTPETKIPNQPPEPFGPEASEFTRQCVEGRQVRLEFDRERRDQYGRTLAYVYQGDLFLNEAILLAGFSAAELRYPFRSDMKRRFAQAEQQARQARRGIWSSNAVQKPEFRPPSGIPDFPEVLPVTGSAK